MELQHIIAKIHVDGDLAIDPERVVEVFHRWAANQTLPELLIDVAELLHVPGGPGVILVGHQADYALDNTGHRWGFLYRRKDAVAGTNADRLARAFQSAAHGARLLEDEFKGELKFSRTTFDFIVNDRLLAPNAPETFAAARPEIEACLKDLLGHGEFTVAAHEGDRRQRFGVTVKTAKPFDLAALPAPA